MLSMLSILKLFITLGIFLKYNSENKINKKRTSPYEDAYQLTRVNFVGFQHLNILNKWKKLCCKLIFIHNKAKKCIQKC